MGLGNRGDSGILYKLRILVNSVETPRAKELFIDFLTGDLNRDVHKLRKFSRYFNKCPKLKRTYFDVLSHFQQHTWPRKRSAKTDILGAKNIRIDHIESLWQCDICKKKLKKGIEEHKEKHEKESAKTSPKHEDVKSVNCEFCKATCKKDKLYAHYAGEHNVYCPEEIIFNSGNVLVSTPMDTMGGTAKWFLEQREKAKGNDEKKCKLCKDFISDSIDLLRSHYAAGGEICGHNIDSEQLKYVENFFRAEKKSHFPPPDNKKLKKLSEDVKKKPDVKVDEKKPQNAVSLMYVCECDVATEKYDFAVEHAQRHVINCHPVTLTCQKCEFTFEATCFSDHIARYQNKSCSRDDFIQLQYDYTKLKSPEWYKMFNSISPISRDQIVQSSIYQYTRSVILKASSNTGIAVYQCAECQLCIDPNYIETHCNNKENCVKHIGHACPECKLVFINDNLLETHKEEHKNGPPRLVVFNNKADVESNRALLKLNVPINVNVQPSKESVANVKKKITVISDVEIPDRFCFKCHNYVNNTVFEEHRAKHEEEEKIRLAALERDTNQSTSNNVERDDNRDEIITEETTEVNRNEKNEFSDTDSCSSVGHTVGVTNAMIHEGERHQKVAIAKYKNIANFEDIIEETPEQVMGDIFSGIASTPLRIEVESQSTQDILLVLDTDNILEVQRKKDRIPSKELLRKMLPEDNSLEGLEELEEELSQLIRES